jgi:hypothetical protein
MDRIKKIEQQLQEIIEQQNKIIEKIRSTKESKKWKLKGREEYWSVSCGGEVVKYVNLNSSEDKWRVNQGNCFKTRKEAQKYLDNLKTKMELKVIAEELNNGEEIDWESKKQLKYCIWYDAMRDKMEDDNTLQFINPSQIYCLDGYFLDEAIKRIGKKRLINMIKSGV